MDIDHRYFMQRALTLAELGRASVSPNPMVGCVIVKNNEILADGFHARAGDAHAEINALQNALNNTEGATLYLTLEPCCHHGRTPPCTDAIIRAGISKVYVACLDPNPLMNGNGVAALRAVGIQVEVGLLEAQAKKLNKIFFHFITHKRPYVIAKWAMSLDGKTITAKNDSRNISSDASRKQTHMTRAHVDAILIGNNTVNNDNPLLTSRIDSKEIKQPIRIILSSKLNLNDDLHVLNDQTAAQTIVVTTPLADLNAIEKIKLKNIDVMILPNTQSGRVQLSALLEKLAEIQITSLLVEGGETVHQSFFKENLVNEVQVYLAPVIIGDLPQKKLISGLQCLQIGNSDDYYFQGNV